MFKFQLGYGSQKHRQFVNGHTARSGWQEDHVFLRSGTTAYRVQISIGKLDKR